MKLKKDNMTKKPRKKLKMIVLILLVVPILISLLTENPKGTSFTGEYFPADNLKFIYDLSFIKDGKQIREHNIINEELDFIAQADSFLILDLFLYNDEYPKDKMSFPNNVKRITDALIDKKAENPEMPIVLITDPLNNFYGSYEQKHITRLKNAGIDVVVTNLDKLKDSNPLLSGYYRCYFRWFSAEGGNWIKNFFDPDAPKVNVRSILKLANFKANHRKTLVSEDGAIISTSNPHDASANHSNIAVRFTSNMQNDLIESEKNVAKFSGYSGDAFDYTLFTDVKEDSHYFVSLITEEGIYKALLENINEAQKGDEIDIGIFYISERNILKALGKASKRGVSVRIVADPNKDAFGITKNGSPNRDTLHRLVKKYPDIKARWYDTHGEQYHVKTAYFKYNKNSTVKIVTGSCNYTRRNMRGLNLESNVQILLPADDKNALEMKNYFDTIFSNTDGQYTTELEKYPSPSFIKSVLWTIQEYTGLCTW